MLEIILGLVEKIGVDTVENGPIFQNLGKSGTLKSHGHRVEHPRVRVLQRVRVQEDGEVREVRVLTHQVQEIPGQQGKILAESDSLVHEPSKGKLSHFLIPSKDTNE